MIGEFRVKSRQLLRDLLQLMVGKPGLPSPRFKERAVQRREQPRLDLRPVAQLMSFRRPDVERVLGQIPRVGFRSREAHRESVKRFVVLVHNRFKWIGCIHVSFGFAMSKNCGGDSFHRKRNGTMGLRSRSRM